MKKGYRPTCKDVWDKYQKSVQFKQQLGLYQTVEENENLFLGRQWEGVQANGLPTPVFNFTKRVTMFQVATITSDNIAARVTPILPTEELSKADVEKIADIASEQITAIFDRIGLIALLRQYVRNAAVDGDAALYTYFDQSIKNGQKVKGEIQTEVIENTRVHFGNPNSRDVQGQQWMIISRRLPCEDVKERAEDYGADEETLAAITPDEADHYSKMETLTDDRTTLLLFFWRDRETKTIWQFECTEKAVVRKAIDTETEMFPITWLSWDYIQDSCHGQAAITGLKPNQLFINRLFAMTMVSLMTTAYPKIVYDKTRLPNGWDSRVGAAIAVNGGDVSNIAKIMDPASISPQIGEFIKICIDYTQNFMGASDVAMGDARPDNTSAIVALQRAANTPLELTKQNLYHSLEELCRIYLDQMAAFYGTRRVEMKGLPGAEERPFGIDMAQYKFPQEFDFKKLRDILLSVTIDVGASSYWSEIAAMQTLDNLLMKNKIGMVDYLERMPSGYIPKKQELISTMKQQMQPVDVPDAGGGGEVMPEQDMTNQLQIRPGGGNGALQRAIAKGGDAV